MTTHLVDTVIAGPYATIADRREHAENPLRDPDDPLRTTARYTLTRREPLHAWARETCRDCGTPLATTTAKNAGRCTTCIFNRL
jgi:tRNA A37 threonylcarbamoyladenosine synthetase subunit TsaC/SUA5/YrdC